MKLNVNFPGVTCSDCEQLVAQLNWHNEMASRIGPEIKGLRDDNAALAEQNIKLKAELEFFKNNGGGGGVTQ